MMWVVSREKLLSVLLKFESLFDGTLGDWNLPPISFELKEGTTPEMLGNATDVRRSTSPTLSIHASAKLCSSGTNT